MPRRATVRGGIAVGTGIAGGGSVPTPGPLLPAVLVALATTLAAGLASQAASLWAAHALAPRRSRRRTEARATEAGWTASLAQRWFRSPVALGGADAPADGYAGLSFESLGLAAAKGHPTVRRTAVGTYRLVPVAPCAALDACAGRVGAEPPRSGGLLIVGTCEVPGEAVAVLVLGPLMQVRLAAVPWVWIRHLTTPAVDPLLPSALPEPALPEPTAAPARPLHTLPQRERRMPSWRSPKPTTRRRGARRAPERTAV